MMKRQRKRWFSYGMLLLIILGLTACGKNIEIIQLSNDVEINSNDDILTLISCNDENATIEIIESNIDFKRTGTYNARFLAETDKKSVEQSFEFNVVDTTPPEATTSSNIVLGQNEAYSLGSYVEVSDNSGIEPTIEFDKNNFNNNEVGEYTIPFKVTDETGNVFKDSLNVKVELLFEDYELQAIKLVKFLKGYLKNPESLQVHEIKCKKFYDGEESSHFMIDYSAQNGFGGLNRDTYYIEIKSSEPTKFDLDEFIMLLEQSNFSGNSSVLDVNVDVDKIMNNLNK